MSIICPSCKYTKIGYDYVGEPSEYVEIDPNIKSFHILEPDNLFKIKATGLCISIFGCPKCGTLFIDPRDNR